MKNKEIEELLNDMSKVYEAHVKIIDKYNNADEIHYASPISLKQIKLLLSYIEQLELDYKEANESITWWQNRYNAIVKQNDDNHKKVVKLENNRDKAINHLDLFISETNLSKYDTLKILMHTKKLLKGGSDE